MGGGNDIYQLIKTITWGANGALVKGWFKLTPPAAPIGVNSTKSQTSRRHVPPAWGNGVNTVPPLTFSHQKRERNQDVNRVQLRDKITTRAQEAQGTEEQVGRHRAHAVCKIQVMADTAGQATCFPRENSKKIKQRRETIKGFQRQINHIQCVGIVWILIWTKQWYKDIYEATSRIGMLTRYYAVLRKHCSFFEVQLY